MLLLEQVRDSMIPHNSPLPYSPTIFFLPQDSSTMLLELEVKLITGIILKFTRPENITLVLPNVIVSEW